MYNFCNRLSSDRSASLQILDTDTYIINPSQQNVKLKYLNNNKHTVKQYHQTIKFCDQLTHQLQPSQAHSMSETGNRCGRCGTHHT